MRTLLLCLVVLSSACTKEGGSSGGEAAGKAGETPATAPAAGAGKVQEEAAPGEAEAKGGEQAPVPTSKEQQEEVEDQAIGAKLNAYIDCLNAFSNKVYEARDRYYYWVDEKKGLTGKESPKYGTFTLPDPAECEKGMTAARTEKPALPDLEKAGDAYLALLKQLVPLHQEIYDYYEKRNYSDDKMKRGFELDKLVPPLWKQFGDADKAMRGEIVKLNDALQERSLARLEKTDGRKLPFLHGNLMAKAKAVVQLGSVKTPEELPLAEFTTALEALTAAQKEFSDYAAAHKDEAGQWSGLSWLQSAADEFHQTATELMRRKRDNEKYSPGEKKLFSYDQGVQVDGSPEKLIKTFNDLVDKSNSAR